MVVIRSCWIFAVYVSCKHSPAKGAEPVSHCDSGVLEAGMPIHSVALCSYGQAAFANPNQTSILGSGGNLQLPRAKKK